MYMSKYSNNCIHMYFIQSINEFWKGYKLMKKTINILTNNMNVNETKK